MLVNADFLIDKKLFKNKQIAKIIKTLYIYYICIIYYIYYINKLISMDYVFLIFFCSNYFSVVF